MANGNGPTWATKWDLGLKTAAVVGLVVVYFTHGCEFNQLQNKLSNLELSVKDANTKLADAQAEAAKSGIQLSNVQAELTAAQKAKTEIEIGPRIVVTPQLDQPQLDEPLQEVRLVLIISNIGNASAKISSAEVDVFRGSFSASASKVVENAKNLLRLERQMRPPDVLFDTNPKPPSDPNTIANAQQELQRQYDELHKDCPHGRLFQLEGTTDMDWKKALILRKQSEMVLTPGQSVRVEFVLMSTHFYRHPLWLRLEPFVTVDKVRRSFGDLLTPIQPVDGRYGAKQVAKVVYQPASAGLDPEGELTSYVPINSTAIPTLPTTKSEAIVPTDK